MKITKKTNKVLISSYNFEGFCDIEWSLVIDNFYFSVEVPLELKAESSRYDEELDQEIPFAKNFKFKKIKLSNFNVYPSEPIDLVKIEINGDQAVVFLG